MVQASKHSNCELILALDLPTKAEALQCLDDLGDSVRWVKIGLQLFTLCGPELVREIADRGYQIFLDLKLHDIPNTVAKAVESICQLPVDLLTLHASGGAEMLGWAAKARDSENPSLRLLAVTVLTSMDGAGLQSIGVNAAPQEQVERLAALSLEAGIDGLVCSPLELAVLRKRFGPSPLIVTPGIRPTGAAANEQKRIMTPEDARQLGASMIVVGRPILASADPRSAALSIRTTLETETV
ncbi:MAG: orotidine-5'-phosphate decarboxylase [Puniceicoccaceae bacterium]|nr:MAG: orotidine-5'-phosphate decarboxylase [Puniceicoccaceae bacterium]